jgi:hypothetical protein
VGVLACLCKYLCAMNGTVDKIVTHIISKTFILDHGPDTHSALVYIDSDYSIRSPTSLLLLQGKRRPTMCPETAVPQQTGPSIQQLAIASLLQIVSNSG